MMPVFLPYGVALSCYSSSGRPVVGRHERRVGVASAYLADLILSEDVELDDGLVRVVRSDRSEVNFGNRLISEMESDGQCRDLAFWIHYAAMEKPDLAVLDELSAQGAVQTEKTPILGSRRYRRLDPSLLDSWNRWVRSEFSGEPSCRACALLAIALACGVEKHVFWDLPVSRLEDRGTGGHHDLECKQNIDSIFLAARSVAMGLAGGPGASDGGVA